MAARASMSGDLLSRAIARPVAVLAGVLALLLFGLLALARLPVQLTPDVSVPSLTVTTLLPGASPEEIEAAILGPQEEALRGIQGLVMMRSWALMGKGQVELHFAIGTPIAGAIVRASNHLAQVADYPAHAREPVIATASNAGPPLVVLSITANHGRVEERSDWVEHVAVPQLKRVRGVANIQLVGGRARELHVDLDPHALAARGLAIPQVAERTRAALRDLSAGDVQVGKRRHAVRTMIAPSPQAGLEEVVVGVADDGVGIALGDVARVSYGAAKPTGVALTDDARSMILLLWGEAGTNVIEVTQGVRAAVDELEASSRHDQDLEFEILADQVGYIEEAIGLAGQSLALGGLLAILVLLLFLRSFRAAGLIALSIPICMIGTVLGMAIVGSSINVISLAGMAFAVGMVVDSAIVVLESIDAHRRGTATPAAAASAGARAVWGAILASTLTTLVVFLPILAWQGELGDLLRDSAAAISCAVLLSMLVSVLVIPSFAASLLPRRPRQPARAGGGLDRLRATVAAQVRWLIRRPARAAVAVAVAVAASIGLALALLPAVDYLPGGNRNLVFGVMMPPPGYSVDEIEAIGRRVQARMAEHRGVERDGVPALEHSYFIGEPTRMILGCIAADDSRVRDLVPFVRAVEAEVPGMFASATQVSFFSRKIGTGRSVEVDLTGRDLDQLIEVGREMLGTIKEELPGAQVRPIPSLELGGPELRVRPAHRLAGAHGLDGETLALLIDVIVDGAIIGELVGESGPALDVVLRAQRPAGLEEITDVPLTTPSGEVAPLESLVRIEEAIGPTIIQRIEQERAISLIVSPPPEVVLEEALETVEVRVLALLRERGVLPPEVAIAISGSAGQIAAAKGRFGEALLLALAVSYLLLAALFEDLVAPVAVLIAAPLSGAGGVLGLWLVDRYLGGQALDMMTAMGFLILIGVVVNNAILIVDAAIAGLRRGEELERAVGGAVRSRVRPILMSSLTTVAGLVPLVVAPGSGSEFYRGVGAVVLGGIALSTALTLYATPCLFALLVGEGRRFTARGGGPHRERRASASRLVDANR